MALGGGFFISQNKVLPGSYINFISASRASAVLSDRGFIALPIISDWGIDGQVFEVTSSDFEKNSLELFGYGYTHDKIKCLRDVFKNANTVYAYRVNSGEKASGTLGTAKCSGTRGNSITISTEEIDEGGFTVTTLFDGNIVDSQVVTDINGLIDNNYVSWNKEASLSAGNVNFSGGTNKESVVDSDFQQFLDKIESFSFNVLICPSDDDGIKDLFISFTKTMREDNGIKFQTIIYDKAADYEGIVNVINPVSEDDEFSAVYWVGGAIGGCAVNRSITNKTYDGEFNIKTDYKQSELIKAINEGKFMFHKCGDDIKVLDDINSFISFTDDKNKDFSLNQVIRVIDQVGNDIAVLFNTKYLGKVQNNQSGRTAFWNDIVTYNRQLENIGAIEDFVADDVIVEKGIDKNSVVVTNPITPAAAMTKLYMTVIVQ